jgi:hypothetical protein
MDIKDKQRAVIEILLFEDWAGEKIAKRLRNVYGSVAYCCTSVFRWISVVRRGTKNLETHDVPDDRLDTKLT